MQVPWSTTSPVRTADTANALGDTVQLWVCGSGSLKLSARII